jgi:2-polyprenyl-6-methoxyphenol hydroxylase-like FAD-dependent oxidoreductase
LSVKGVNLGAALASYEREMLVRSRKYVLLSRHAAREMHSTSRWAQRLRNAKLTLANHFLKRRRR